MTDRYHFRPAERHVPGALLRPLHSTLTHDRPSLIRRIGNWQAETGQNKVWQAERFDLVVGVIAWQREPRSQATATVAVNVDASCRGQGVGRFLLEQAVTAARETGLRTLLARVSRDNSAALALFSRSGFRPLLESSANERGEAAIWLGKSLVC